MKSWFKMEMKAERVLPEPVGEQMSTFLPCWMRGTAWIWGGVKRPLAELKEASHQSRTMGSKRERMAASSGKTCGAGGTGVSKAGSTILRWDYAGCEIDLLAVLC
jgi:hypothetical protein